MSPSTLVQQIDQALSGVGIAAAIEDDHKTITLSGLVDSERARLAAEDIVHEIAPDRRIDNGLEVESILPADVDSFQDESSSGELAESASDLLRAEDQINPDFSHRADSVMSISDNDNEDLDEPSFPPTDPVITPSNNRNAEILGGFSETSMDDVTAEPSTLDGKPGDESLEDAVRRELLEDASTTSLTISVLVRNGTAFLRGAVEGPEDVDNAESVAGRVPGVREVIETLEISSLPSDAMPRTTTQ